MSNDRLMTDHAVVRWLERVERINLGSIVSAYVDEHGEQPKDWELLNYIEDRWGLSRDDVEKSVVSPSMRMAASCGVCHIRADGFLFILRDGRVVTISPLGIRPRLGQSKKQRKHRRREPRRGRVYDMMEGADG